MNLLMTSYRRAPSKLFRVTSDTRLSAESHVSGMKNLQTAFDVGNALRWGKQVMRYVLEDNTVLVHNTTMVR